MTSEILECPIDTFLTHYAPFIPSKESIDNALQAFKDDQRTDQLLEEYYDGDKKFWTWTDFDPSPAKPDADEGRVFKPLQEIVDFLNTDVECREKSAADGPTNALRTGEFSYRNCPSTMVESEISGATFRMDGCITSNPTSQDIILSDTAVVAEFKKTNNASNAWDNRLKVVSAASHILNDDPCRTWAYGITIEGTQMSVWYFCRSHSVKSESFDFTRDIEKFIQVFLSFLYASRKEIGYDPTVHRVTQSDKICYVYEMGTEEEPQYFKTTGLLFTSRVLCTTGRKTRVWEAIEVKGLTQDELQVVKGEPVALKDGWLDEDSKTEGEIQAAIFKQLEGIRDTNYKWAPDRLREILDDAFKNNGFKDYFMEIVQSRKIATTKARSPQAQPNPSILSPPPLTPADSKKNVVANSTQNKDYSGLPSDPQPAVSRKRKKNSPPREYRIKQQHRLIYRDVGCPLHHAEDIKTSFLAIKHTFIALVLMYLAGWTHRDVSTGNIIIIKHKDGSQGGKLSDLEYAKQFDNHTQSPDPKTGTPFFMPLEIHMSDRLYIPARRPQELDEDHMFAPREDQSEASDVYSGKPPPKFRFQHDLESLWWIALWVLLYRVDHPEARKAAVVVFTHGDYPTPDRIELFKNEEFTKWIKSIIPKELFPVVDSLDNIRAMLLFSYVDKDYSEDQEMLKATRYTEIYRTIWKGFNVLTTLAQAISIKLENSTSTVDDTNETVLQKRPRPNSKPRDEDEYEPVADSSEEEDSEDQTRDDTDEPKTKKPKLMVDSLRRRQMGL